MSTINFCAHCRAEISDQDPIHIHTSEEGKKVYLCDKCHKEKRFNIIHKARTIFGKIILGI